MQNSEVYPFLMEIAKKLNRPQEEMMHLARKLIEENWLDTLESLRSLGNDDWKALKMPIRLVNTIKYELAEYPTTHTPDPLVTTTSSSYAETTTTSSPSTAGESQVIQPTTSESQEDLTMCEYFENDDSIFSYSLQNISEKFDSEFKTSEGVEAIKTLLKIIDNVLAKPSDPKKRLLKKSNKTFSQTVGQYEATTNTLLACGFVETEDSYKMPIAYISRLTDFHHFLANKLGEFGIPKPQLPASDAFNPYSSQFNFTSMDTRKLHKIINNNDQEDSTLLLSAIENRKSYLKTGGDTNTVDLNPKYYPQSALKKVRLSPPSLLSQFGGDEIDTAPISMSELASIKESLSENPQFQSRAKKELQNLNKKRAFASCAVRVLFPDKMVLEMTFKPDTTLREVKDSIKKFLLPEFLSKDWYIYETPPVKNFNLRHTLYEENLVPNGIIHFNIKGEEKVIRDSYLDSKCFNQQ